MTMDFTTGLFLLIILLVSFMVRNLVYGYVANQLGDPTARLSGRLTANPLTHIDLFGSIILPGLLIFTGTGIIIGWPKPMPYNIYNFRNQKWGEVWLGLAGSAANLGLAAIFAALIWLQPSNPAFIDFAVDVVLLNLFLAFFTLLPIPPLDGSKMIGRLLPLRWSMKYDEFIRYLEHNPLIAILVIFVVFLLVFGELFFVFVATLASLMTGLDIGTILSLYR
jgi:Zn-dependent protease